MTARGYALERRGSIDDLAKLGLTLETALGRQFTFYMDDGDDHGRPDDIMWEGLVVHDGKYGYLAEEISGDFYHRSDIDGDA
jgi:hypothetical protein